MACGIWRRRPSTPCVSSIARSDRRWCHRYVLWRSRLAATTGSFLEVYQQVQHEVDRVLQGRIPTYADLTSLPYTLQVLKETMRLYPPAYGFGRVALHDVEVDGYVIRAEQGAFISPYTLQRNIAQKSHVPFVEGLEKLFRRKRNRITTVMWYYEGWEKRNQLCF